jgi:hypothetical protein
MRRSIRNRHLIIVSIILLVLATLLVLYNAVRSSNRKISVLSISSLVSSEKAASFDCPLRGEHWIVVTSILYPTPAIRKFLNLTTRWNLIVIGDRKTPRDWHSRLQVNRSRIIFLPIHKQRSLGYSILKYLPENSYARKNIGYLVAIACGARVIFESDDDNLVQTNDIHVLPKIAAPDDVPWGISSATITLC